VETGRRKEPHTAKTVVSDRLERGGTSYKKEISLKIKIPIPGNPRDVVETQIQRAHGGGNASDQEVENSIPCQGGCNVNGPGGKPKSAMEVDPYIIGGR